MNDIFVDFILKINMSNFKFSGHDTFHCRQQWLTKGVKLIDIEGYSVFNRPEIAISKLGVGKNMVLSIAHWLKSFGLFDGTNLNEIARLIFIENNGFDPYLEDEGTLWLLHYKLCNTKYASIYHIIFSEFFSKKVKLEFTEREIIKLINDKLYENGEREVSDNTLSSDFKAFIRTYSAPKKSLKTIEDDFNSPLMELNLISELEQNKYTINKEIRDNIPLQIFGYCLIDFIGDEVNMKIDKIRTHLGAYFCLTNEGLDNLLAALVENYAEFTDKEDAGLRQITIKNTSPEFKLNLLRTYYGIQ